MLEDLASSFWFRSLFPIAVGLLYELGTRYVRKDQARFDQEDWYIALPAIGAAITALPPLTALRVRDVAATGSEADAAEVVALGGLIVAFLVIVAFIFANFDRRVLMPRRPASKFWRSVLVTWIPNAGGIGLAVASLWIVAP